MSWSATWWLHRGGMLVLRVGYPAGFLLVAIVLVVYGFSHDASVPDVLLIRILASSIAIGSVVMLVALNTRRARRRLGPFAIDEDESDRAE